MESNAPNYVQGNYTVAERDAIFAKADKYPDATLGLQNQVPTLAADGSIIWRNQSSGGGDGTANANIATVEDTSTASRAYAVGDLLIYSGNLYTVTAAIEELDTIVPGTNVTPTTVAAVTAGKQDVTSYSSGDIDTYLAMVAAANAIASAGVAPGGFGLGMTAAPTVTDLNDVGASGFYKFGGTASHIPAASSGMLLDIHYGTNYATQFAFMQDTYHTIWRRQRVNVQWGNATAAWECLNPPMDVGTEYQTTERFLGKPVFVKVVECAGAAGSTEAPANASTAHGVANIDSVVSVIGCIDSRTIPYHFMTSGGTTEEWLGVVANKTNIILSGNSDKSGTTYKIVFKYTKT